MIDRVAPVPSPHRITPVRSSFRIAPLPFRSVIVGEGLVSLVEIHFANGTRYYSFEGVSSPSGWWSDSLVSIGAISEEAPILPGAYRVGDTTVTLNNTSLEFSKLRDETGFRNVRVRIRHGNAMMGIAGLLTRFTGEISDWRFSGSKVEFTVRDVSYDRFRSKIGGVFNANDFPNCPGENLGFLIPIIYGRVEGPESTAEGRGRGAITAYLVDPHHGEPYWTYVCARHPLKQILRVYHYERLLPQNFAIITTRQYGNYQCQILQFTGEMRQSDLGEAPEITFDAEGLTETGGSSGLLIENPARQLEHFLIAPDNRAGIKPDEIDQSSFGFIKFVFESVSPLAGYKGAFALVDENQTYADVIERFCTSFNLYFNVNRFGKFAIYAIILDSLKSSAYISEVSDNSNILQDSFEIQNIPDPVTRLQYNYRYQWSRDYFYRQPDDNLPEEEITLGREVRDSVNLWYVADDFTAASVASERHQYMRESTQAVRFDLPPVFFAQSVNDHVRLTHWQGIHFSGLGYNNQRFRITGLNHSFSPDSMRVAVTALRIPEPVAVVVPSFIPGQESILVGPSIITMGF